MENTYITKIVINKVRHLRDIEIPLSDKRKKHVILTGKNGSGKTSTLEAIAFFLNTVINLNDSLEDIPKKIADLAISINDRNFLLEFIKSENGKNGMAKRLWCYLEKMKMPIDGIWLDTQPDFDRIRTLFLQGDFVVAYYRADRIFQATEPKHVEKVELKNGYSIYEKPRNELIKYLLDLKMTEALAFTGRKTEKANAIREWFVQFEILLKKIFENPSVRLVFDEESFQFSICMEGREPFDFNTLSSGYAAILDIVVDLILRMEKQANRRFDFLIPGIVLIDEIETHLHLELQKNIMELLTSVFPNIQFIVSTHSPFILNSLEDVVIYDLENRMLVENGLANIPYAGVVEGYFKADELSAVLKEKYQRYKELVKKPELADKDFDEIADLEFYLNEIPDYLALGITTEYQRLKQELRGREDI